MKPFEINADIEGATPLNDISGLKPRWINTHETLDAAEADNILIAYGKYLGKKPYSFPNWFTVEHINQVHKLMFGKVWSWAGKYRKTEKSIGIKPYKIGLEMVNLEQEISFWDKEKIFHPIEISAKIHHRLVWIHPYENGNGRHGRFIGDMVLRAFGYQHAIWPRTTTSGHDRSKYINTLKEADRGDFTTLIQFLVDHGVKKI